MVDMGDDGDITDLGRVLDGLHSNKRRFSQRQAFLSVIIA
jgi:hypothetical protein